ncbi:MAG: DUF1428 domain-containing protein [Ignavibacteriae bacterium]|nr:MAG: DUF1428 domain-containing protein [Ignavibacteriota bacterium]
MNGYIDLFALPVPKKNLRRYCKFSARFGKITKEYGALEYREFVGDDLNVKGLIPFPSKIKIKTGEVLISAVIGFRSKAHRNLVNKKVQKDPRIIRMGKEFMENPLTDMKRMLYGGFATIVKA